MGTAQTAKTGTAVQPRSGEAPAMLYLVYFIYFFCGLTQCFEGVFLPEFKEFFHLTYQQQMYTVFAKNIPFLAAVLLGSYLVRIGYKTCLAMAMTLYALGTFLLIAGLQAAHYEIVLLAFFLIGTGFTSQMVAGNPLLSLLGPPKAPPVARTWATPLVPLPKSSPRPPSRSSFPPWPFPPHKNFLTCRLFSPLSPSSFSVSLLP